MVVIFTKNVVICARFGRYGQIVPEGKDARVVEVPEGKDARVVEEARLESVYTPKAYPGFESPSFRKGLELITRLKQINITNN